MGQRVSIQTEDFDLSTEVARLRLQDKRVGAVCSFIGTVRDRNDGQSVSTMELEHYPGMTERELARVEAEATKTVEHVETRKACSDDHGIDPTSVHWLFLPVCAG